MRLRRIAIRNFRKLADLEIAGLGDGLTLLSGDNEEGKSTILAALKAALFEHHTVGGAVREAMGPLGRQDTPEVAVDLELGGGRYALRKEFRRGGVRLATPTGELRDDAAEQKLLELLRFERRQGRSEAKPQHLGLQALFWVDQGTTFAGFDGLAGGRERLSRAIEAEVGGVAIGERGRRLMALVEGEKARFWTGTGRQTGELAEAERRRDASQATVAELRASQARYEQAVDRLAQLREERRRVIAADDLGRAQQALERIRQELGTIEKLEARRERARAEHASRCAAWRDAAALVEQRRVQREQLAALVAGMAQARSDAAQAAAGRDAAEAALAAADRREKELGTQVVAAQELRLATERRLLRLDLEAQIGRVVSARQEAASATAIVRSVGAALAANPATAERLDSARRADRERAMAQAALRAVATRVELIPQAGASVRRNGQPIDPAAPLHVTERTELELVPFGRIVLSPGAGDLDERKAALRRADDTLAQALIALGADRLEAAEALLGERNRLELRLGEAKARLAAVLQGNQARDLAALDDHLAELAGRREQLAAGTDGEPLADIASLRLELARLDLHRQEVQAARDAAAAETARCRTGASAAREAFAVREHAVELLGQRQAAAEAQLAADRERRADTLLDEELAAALSAMDEAEAVLNAVEREVLAANADLVRDRLAQAERRLADLRAETMRLDGAVRDCEVELRTLGADAVGERLAESVGRLETAEQDHARLLREGHAWRLLSGELASAASSARDALLTPVRDRLRPYLQRLFPGAEPVLDPQTLELTHLRRAGQDERFAQLSVGTREQIAVLVRLAMARLLLEREGEAPCILLDDALVYADEGRFEIMKTILQQASRELQILILTCRPRDYLGLEAAHVRLGPRMFVGDA